MRIDRFFHAPVPQNAGRNPVPIRAVEAVRPVPQEDMRRPLSEFVQRSGAAVTDLPTDRRIRQALEAYLSHSAPETAAATLFGVDVYV